MKTVLYIAFFFVLLACPTIELMVIIDFGWLDSYVSHGELVMAWMAEYCLMMTVISVEIEPA